MQSPAWLGQCQELPAWAFLKGFRRCLPAGLLLLPFGQLEQSLLWASPSGSLAPGNGSHASHPVAIRIGVLPSDQRSPFTLFTIAFDLDV
jgi:hypothetical protein